MIDEKELMEKAKRYAEGAKVTLGTVGRRAANSPLLFTRLTEDGSISCTIATYKKADAWLDEQMKGWKK